MPEVFRVGNLKFIIFFHDHWPPHVHIYGPGSEAKFEIYTGKCIEASGFNRTALAGISRIVFSEQLILIEAWEKYEKEKI